MITIVINTDNAAWMDGDAALELESVLEQVSAFFGTVPCGPSGYTKPLRDSYGNPTGSMAVTNG